MPATRPTPFIIGQLAFALALVASALSAIPARAQAVVALTRPSPQGEWVIEMQGRQRWMNDRQQPRFTRFTPLHESVIVDSIRSAGAERRIWLTTAGSAYGRDSALIVLDRYGRVARLDFGRAPPSRLWDLVPAAPPRPPFVGLTWHDTIAVVATEGSYRQAMHGSRISRIFGERMLDGHRVWLVRDEAQVMYDEQYPERERTLAGTWISRAAMGTIRAVYLLDPALPIPRQSDDTTRLSGVAILHYPDGRNFPTSARFERTRHRDLLDPAAYAARVAELRASRLRGSGGMVMVPDNALESRLARGDMKVRDSLLAAWQRTSDPGAAESIFRTLQLWGARGAESRARIEDARVAMGDTAYLYQLLANRASDRHPLDTADVSAMLPFMKDPGLAWSFDVSREELDENLAQALTTRPPAATSSADSAACTPAACRMLADQWRTATEPRLRQVALVALFVTDPTHWTDTVLAMDDPDNTILHDAAELARGVGATWPAASHAPMPAAGADWRAWLEWMDGRNPRFTAMQKQLPARLEPNISPQVRFEDSHATAIRFTEVRTGRNIVAELQHDFDTAPSDSARLVFGAMLHRLGRRLLTESQIVESFRSGDSARVALARDALGAGFQASATPADSSVTVPLLERLLVAIVDSAPLWPHNGAAARTSPSDPATLHMPRGRFFIDTLGIPPRTRATWGARVTFTSQAAWDARDVRKGGVFYTISPVTTWGHFARIEVQASERNPRQPNELPAVNASGKTYMLMNVDGEWVVVDEDGWVT